MCIRDRTPPPKSPLVRAGGGAPFLFWALFLGFCGSPKDTPGCPQNLCCPQEPRQELFSRMGKVLGHQCAWTSDIP
eukprot:7245732-Alexandrium_andersonii.AAC.1